MYLVGNIILMIIITMLNVRRINMSNTGPCSMFRALRDSSVILLVVTILAVSISLIGCTEDEFAKNSYVTLESARIIYDTTMTLAADMKVDGSITDEDWSKLVDVATPFQVSGSIASTLVAEYVTCYKSNPTSSETKTAKEMAVHMIDTLKQDYKTLLPRLVLMGISDKLPVLK